MKRTMSTMRPNGSKLRLPKRILLVRHGQSLGNVNEEAYHTIPDWLIPLTEVGEQQALDMGHKIKEMIGNDPIYVYYSPYLRTRQTMVQMMQALEDNPIYGIREEPRITEQQFGNFQNFEMSSFKKEKESFGRFYYRYPEGESGLDVYNRVTSFIGTLFREWYAHTADEDFRDSTIIIVTHGLTLRLFIMRWFHFTIHQFEQSRNPGNAEIIVMERVIRRSHKSNNTDNSNKNPDHNNVVTGTSLTSENEYLLDSHHPNHSSYEKVEWTNRSLKNPHFFSQQKSQSRHLQTPPAAPQPPPAEDLPEESTFVEFDNLEEEETPTPTTSSVTATALNFLEELESFVLTKTSQDLLNFHIPKPVAPRSSSSSSYPQKKVFYWKEYNQTYQLTQEITEDLQSLHNCPRQRFERLRIRSASMPESPIPFQTMKSKSSSTCEPSMEV